VGGHRRHPGRVRGLERVGSSMPRPSSGWPGPRSTRSTGCSTRARRGWARPSAASSTT
jgi:hypothetical protein